MVWPHAYNDCFSTEVISDSTSWAILLRQIWLGSQLCHLICHLSFSRYLYLWIYSLDYFCLNSFNFSIAAWAAHTGRGYLINSFTPDSGQMCPHFIYVLSSNGALKCGSSWVLHPNPLWPIIIYPNCSHIYSRSCCWAVHCSSAHLSWWYDDLHLHCYWGQKWSHHLESGWEQWVSADT